jgi:predicted nucleic acid-binding protein
MIYLDSSVLFSVQGRDSNTFAAVSLLQSASEPLVLTPLCEVEFINALSLRIFRNVTSHAQAQASASDLELNLRNGVYQLVPFPEAAFTRAKVLAQTITPSIGVRSADLLHVAAALEIGARSLYTFDIKQHKTARAAGLAVNPLPVLP